MPVMQIKGGKFVLFETPPDKPFTCLDTSRPPTRRRSTNRSHQAEKADADPSNLKAIDREELNRSRAAGLVWNGSGGRSKSLSTTHVRRETADAE